MSFTFSNERPWLHALAVAGKTARGFVYLVAGGATAYAAANAKRDTTDLREAFSVIYNAPFGQVLLGTVAAGLGTYALWRALVGILDAENRGTGAKALVRRAADLFVAAIYVSLTVLAVRLTLGASERGGGGDGTSRWAARLLEQPFGQWLAGIVGLVIVGVGVHRLRKAWRGNFPELRSEWLRAFARWGNAARGVIFLVIGGFFLMAAIYRSPGQARGLEGALQFLSNQPAGAILVLVAGIGLALYGVVAIAEAFILHGRKANVPGAS
ncbi:MAG: DUF1206 domain-containing protein [Chthoniobacterales bacterium]|nr:DUF1206 domain-containing protein [Chthoniobacterales bacterium]